ncbi:hypothetical protein EDC04DRAFT_2609141 [Pisolithus marmoratus]|nr:hypothetical protein EDC04DRAFT_2609141 [Pisolithus marmoratus]
MTAFHSLFTNDEQQHHRPFRAGEPLFFPASKRLASPIGTPLDSTFQDSIACQPMHPDRPRAPWDSGLNLSSDPITATEHKSVEECETKAKRQQRRLRSTMVAFEFLFGLWGVYTTIRYFLAFSTTSDHTQRIFALALGVASATAVAANIISITSPLFHDHLHVRSSNHTRFLLRACYLLLLLSASTTNLVLVAVWHPNNRCEWDIDLSWYTSTVNTPSTRCHPTSFAVWIIAATLRQLVTSIIAVLFIYIAHASHLTSSQPHTPTQRKLRSYQPAFSFTDPEDTSPTDTTARSSPTLSTFKHVFTSSFIRPSQKRLGRSNSTLVRSSSSGTIVPFASHTAGVPSSPPKGISLNNNTMPPSWLANSGTNFNSNMKTSIPRYPSWASTENNVNLKMEACQQLSEEGTPTKSPILRRMSRLWDSQNGLASPAEKTTLEGTSYPTHFGSTTMREILNPVAGPGYDSDVERDSSDQSTAESEVLSHIYGQTHLYPPAALHNPSSSPSDGSTHDEGSSSPMSDTSGGEDDEYVPMMGGYVRRLSTIESLGSREVSTLAGTTSSSMWGSMSTAGSICPSMMMGSASSSSSIGAIQACGRPPASALHFSPLQLGRPSSSHAALSLSVPPSLAPSGSTGTSRSTVYLSVSSGSIDDSAGIQKTIGLGARMHVNERGELLVPERPSASGASSSTSWGHHYWTASSGQSALSKQSSSRMVPDY